MAISNTYKQLIDNIIKSKSLSSLTEEEKILMTTQGFQDALLEYLKDEYKYLNNDHKHLPILEGGDYPDLPSSGTSLFKDLNELIDLDGTNLEAFNAYFTKLIEKKGNLWNESLRNILTIFYDYFYKDGDKIIPIAGVTLPDNKKFKVSDVKEANAGYTFGDNTAGSGAVTNPDDPYVRKYTNIDGDGYKDVRGNDKIESVLNKRNKLQFTHSQSNDNPLSKYIRLLMPMYDRRVEVEDLNRNFWVIGQTITAISAYLFDDDSPIKKMFKYLSSEIVQIWENLIYLWALIKTLTTPKEHIAIVDLPNNELQNFKKFDNFDYTTLTDAEIISRLGYLKKEYPHCNLTIIPVARQGNYEHNYYNKEIYLGVYKYNVNTGNETFEFINIDANTVGIEVSPSKCSNNILHIGEVDQQTKKCTLVLGTEDLPVTTSEQFYYSALRIKPTIDETNGKKLVLTITDAIAEAAENAFTVTNRKIFKEEYTINLDTAGCTHDSKVDKSSAPSNPKVSFKNIKGYYLGEDPSERFIVDAIPNYEAEVSKKTLRPIAPSIKVINETTDLKNALKYTKGGTNEESKVINEIIKALKGESTTQYKIYRCTHPTLLIKQYVKEDNRKVYKPLLCYFNKLDANEQLAVQLDKHYGVYENNGNIGADISEEGPKIGDINIYGSEIPTDTETPYDDDPRFTTFRQEYITTAILQVPISKQSETQKSDVYACYSPNFSKAIQDCATFFRYDFDITKDKNGNNIPSNAVYGHCNDTYKTLIIYRNKSNLKDWIAKFITVDISFGPQFSGYYNGEDFIGLNTSNSKLPDEYRLTYISQSPSNFIPFNKTLDIGSYSNYNSPFAPIYAWGAPILNQLNSGMRWNDPATVNSDNNEINTNRSSYPKIVSSGYAYLPEADNEQPSVSPGYYYENSVKIARDLERVLAQILSSTSQFSCTIVKNELRGYEWTQDRGYICGPSVLPKNSSTSQPDTQEIIIKKDLIQAYKNAKVIEDGITKYKIYNKSANANTLNKGGKINFPCEQKYYGMTSHINVVYFKSDAVNKSISAYYDLVRINADGRPNLIYNSSNNKYTLKWNKKQGINNWKDNNDNNLTIQGIEDLIENDYECAAVGGDFVNNKGKLICDFSRFPSNGFNSQPDLDPGIEDIFSSTTGNLDPINDE